MLVCSCVSRKLEADLKEQRSLVANQTAEMLARSSESPAIELSWDHAVKLLDERGLGLEQSRQRLAQTKRTRDEQWKNWVPRLGININLFNNLKNLGSLAALDTATTVNIPLIIPNPFTEKARAISNTLSLLEAEDRHLLYRRRSIISLYQLFANHKKLTKNAAASYVPANDQESVAKALSQIESDRAQRRSIESIENRLSQILNMPGKRVVPIPATCPEFDYGKQLRSMSPGKNYGELAVRLASYQVVGSMLRAKGVKYNQLPSISMSASMPSVYDSRRDSAAGDISSEQVNLFGGLSKTYDITDREGIAFENAKKNAEYVRSSLILRLDQEARDWNRLRESYRQLELKRELVSERMRHLQREDLGSALDRLNAFREFQSSMDEIERAKNQLDLEIWLWDDKKWDE